MTAEVWIPLTQGKVAVIDFDDFEKVRGMKWYATKNRRCFYATRNVHRADGKWTKIYLHRFLTSCPPDREVNHINGDGLDNRRDLQICTPQQQQFAFQRKRKGASSEYRGISWGVCRKLWKAQIRHNGKDIFLGRFDSEEAAARAYDAKAIELYGAHAAPNFPI